MDKFQAFDNLVEALNSEPKASFIVESDILIDMGVNFKHLAETTGRNIKEKQIIRRGSDGLPVTVTELEFCPRLGGN